MAPRRVGIGETRTTPKRVRIQPTWTLPVKVHGEPLSEIWWRGRQRAVTRHGIECLDGGYHFEKERLLEEFPDYTWPDHMAGKTWVDLEEFTTAWMVAVLLHRYGRKTLGSKIRKSFAKLPPVNPVSDLQPSPYATRQQHNLLR